MTDDIDLEELDEEIERLESRLEWLEETTVDDLDVPDDTDESVVRGGLKIRRRSARQELKECRRRRTELTNEMEDTDE